MKITYPRACTPVAWDEAASDGFVACIFHVCGPIVDFPIGSTIDRLGLRLYAQY